MNTEQRIIQTQRLTQDYFKTAELLDLTYDQVRSICEEYKEKI